MYYYAQWQMDITSPLMILVQKCSSLAWNLYDGHKQASAIAANKGVLPSVPVLRTSHQRRMAITECPSFIEFLAYVSFPINQAYGPSTEFRMYIDSALRTEPLLHCRIPLFWEQLLLGIICVAYFTHPTDLQSFYTKEFMQRPLLHRIIWSNWAMHWTRMKCD